MSASINDIVQILEGNWMGCLVHVTDTYNWGVQGFIYIPERGHAYVRLKHEEYAIIGHSALIIK